MGEWDAVTEAAWWVLVIGIAEIGLILLAIIWALTYAAKLPSPALVVVALVLVIIMLLIVFALSSDARSAELLALVGVPVGALVAASTAVHNSHRDVNSLVNPVEPENSEDPDA